jgi:hypothetical protein
MTTVQELRTLRSVERLPAILEGIEKDLAIIANELRRVADALDTTHKEEEQE